MIRKFIYPFLFALFSLACREDDDAGVFALDPDFLTISALYLDSEGVSGEVNRLTHDLTTGEPEDFDQLVHRLRLNGIDAELTCYQCIYTLPPVSEIRLYLDSAGVMVNRIIDLHHSDSGPIRCKGVHLTE